jgi:hypothetical protein
MTIKAAIRTVFIFPRFPVKPNKKCTEPGNWFACV